MAAIRNPANAELICTRIAEGFTLRQIARELHCSDGSIVQWRLEDDVFAAQYARAKEAQADRFADEINEIADEGTNDWMQRELENGAIVDVPDHEHISRSKLRVDTRKWLMAKMAPKRYGEKLELEHTGKDGGPIEHAIEDRRMRARAIIDTAFETRLGIADQRAGASEDGDED